jgi:hypothetical protein
VVEHLLEEDGDGYTLKSNVKNPFPTGYKPELDVTDELDGDLASRFMQLIGIRVGQLKSVGLTYILKYLFSHNIRRILDSVILRRHTIFSRT